MKKFLGLSVMTLAFTTNADASMVESIEAMNILQNSSGKNVSFIVPLIAPATQMASELQADLNLWEKWIPSLGYARAIKSSEGGRVLYLKLRDQAPVRGLVMEVRQGLDQIFSSQEVLSLAATNQELGLRQKAVGTNELLEDLKLELSSSKDASRTITENLRVVLHGPLHNVQNFGALGVSIDATLLTYTSTVKDAPQSLLALQLSLSSRATKGPIGDVRGVGDQELRQLASATKLYLSSIQKSFSKRNQ